MKVAKKIICVFVLFVSTVPVIGQKADAILSDFSGFEVDGIVYITATIASGNTCNGIDVLKSTDDYNYQVIGNISGICGSASHPVRYDFVDSIPKLNGINYYLLELGGQGFTKPIQVEVRSFSNNKVQIIPNPVLEQGSVYFENSDNHAMEVYIHNSRGQLIRSFSTNSNKLEYNVADLSKGMYWIRVVNQETSSEQAGIFFKL